MEQRAVPSRLAWEQWGGGACAAVSVHFVMKPEMPQLHIKYKHLKKDFLGEFLGLQQN